MKTTQSRRVQRQQWLWGGAGEETSWNRISDLTVLHVATAACQRKLWWQWFRERVMTRLGTIRALPRTVPRALPVDEGRTETMQTQTAAFPWSLRPEEKQGWRHPWIAGANRGMILTRPPDSHGPARQSCTPRQYLWRCYGKCKVTRLARIVFALLLTSHHVPNRLLSLSHVSEMNHILQEGNHVMFSDTVQIPLQL